MKIKEDEFDISKAVLGLNTTLKRMHEGKLNEILIASNYPEVKENKVKSLAIAYNIPVRKLDINNKKLGIICKKTFNVSILGILKEE